LNEEQLSRVKLSIETGNELAKQVKDSEKISDDILHQPMTF
jgi:hypothetical protein